MLESVKLHQKIENKAIVCRKHDVGYPFYNCVEVSLVVKGNTSLVKESKDRATDGKIIVAED